MSTKAKTGAVIAGIVFILAMRLIFSSKSGSAAFNALTADAEPGLSYSYDSGASFYSFNSKDYFFCTKDGVKYLSSKGEQQWEEIISLSSPVLYGKCDILAVSEPKGRAVYVFNTLGKIMECKFDSPVLSFSVNKTGYLTVILQTASGYRVETYTPGKDTAIWKYVLVKPNVYPISADTSPDGKITAVSLLDLAPDAHHSMTTQIMFIYTYETDALNLDSADGIFAGETLHDQIARLYFMDNRLLAVSDTAITAYSFSSKEKIKKDWELALHNKILRFCVYGETGFGFLTGEPLSGSDEQTDAGTLNFYSMNGRRTGKYVFGSDANYLSMNWGSAIVGNGRNFSAVNNKGALIWSYKSPMDLKQLIFLDNDNMALAAGSTNASVMRRAA